MTSKTIPTEERVSERLFKMRAAGWSVAVHNDYAITLDDGETKTRYPSTFWLFTHPSGVWAKGEAGTDAEAIALAEKQAAERLQSLRSQPTREAVIERSMDDLLLVRADLLAISILGSGECRGLAKDSVKTLDAALRSLKLPTPEGGSSTALSDTTREE